MNDSASWLWNHFLDIRARLIDAMVTEGKSYEQVADTLSVESQQVRLIHGRERVT